VENLVKATTGATKEQVLTVVSAENLLVETADDGPGEDQTPIPMPLKTRNLTDLTTARERAAQQHAQDQDTVRAAAIV
jgi:hypothetical protein